MPIFATMMMITGVSSSSFGTKLRRKPISRSYQTKQVSSLLSSDVVVAMPFFNNDNHRYYDTYDWWKKKLYMVLWSLQWQHLRISWLWFDWPFPDKIALWNPATREIKHLPDSDVSYKVEPPYGYLRILDSMPIAVITKWLMLLITGAGVGNKYLGIPSLRFTVQVLIPGERLMQSRRQQCNFRLHFRFTRMGSLLLLLVGKGCRWWWLPCVFFLSILQMSCLIKYLCRI